MEKVRSENLNYIGGIPPYRELGLGTYDDTSF